MGGQIFVFINFAQGLSIPLKKSASPTIAGGNENLVSLNNGGGCICTIAGLPIFKGQCLTVASVENDQAVRLEYGDIGVDSALK